MYYKIIDEIIYLGDVIGLGPQPVKCLDFIMDHPDITMVRGNHEEKQLFFTDSELHEHGHEHQLWVRERLSKKHFDFMGHGNQIEKIFQYLVFPHIKHLKSLELSE